MQQPNCHHNENSANQKIRNQKIKEKLGPGDIT